MGFFDMLGGLLDEDSPNSLENKLNTALDGIETALGGALDTAESGIQKLDNAVTGLQNGAESFAGKSDAIMTKISEGGQTVSRSLDGILPGGKN